MSRSTAKIMYTDFFTRDNNYGSIIRIFNNMMSFPLINQRAIMFLSGSNAARAYKLIEDIFSLIHSISDALTSTFVFVAGFLCTAISL